MFLEKFIKRNQLNNEWWGFSKNNGWVILDRNFPGNYHSPSDKKSSLTFIRCSDWTEYKEEAKNWEPPLYIFIVSYFKQNKKDTNKEIEDKLNEHLDYYVNTYSKIKEQQKTKILEERLQSIHDNFLESKNLPKRKILKSKSKRRVSHCWNCGHTVDNNSDYECEGCRWIICGDCGACEKPYCCNSKVLK